MIKTLETIIAAMGKVNGVISGTEGEPYILTVGILGMSWRYCQKLVYKCRYNLL